MVIILLILLLTLPSGSSMDYEEGLSAWFEIRDNDPHGRDLSATVALWVLNREEHTVKGLWVEVRQNNETIYAEYIDILPNQTYSLKIPFEIAEKNPYFIDVYLNNTLAASKELTQRRWDPVEFPIELGWIVAVIIVLILLWAVLLIIRIIKVKKAQMRSKKEFEFEFGP